MAIKIVSVVHYIFISNSKQWNLPYWKSINDIFICWPAKAVTTHGHIKTPHPDDTVTLLASTPLLASTRTLSCDNWQQYGPGITTTRQKAKLLKCHNKWLYIQRVYENDHFICIKTYLFKYRLYQICMRLTELWSLNNKWLTFHTGVTCLQVIV